MRNLESQFHLKSHEASSCVVCKNLDNEMKKQERNYRKKKNQEEKIKEKIKVILKIFLLESCGSGGLVLGNLVR